MKTKTPVNPFTSSSYLGEDYFCDRKDETNQLLNNIQNGHSTVLISIRRMGKTGLIKHTFAKLPVDYKGFYIDILETENLEQFLNLLTSSLLNAAPEKSSFGKTIWNFVKSLRPVISFDALTGAPQAYFDLKPQLIESNINSLLQFFENQSFKSVIAIDEFQQIVNYPEKSVEAWLRSRVQHLNNVVFIFSGSQQHLMKEMFTSPGRPFYRSTQLMRLERIPDETYAGFIIEQFQKYDKTITRELAFEILDWTNVHTFYVQHLCSRVFAATKKKVNNETWRYQANLLLREQEAVFFAFRNILTKLQWHLLKAIANEATVSQPTSKIFLNKYDLGTSASVLRSLKALQDYDLVYSDYDNRGNLFYSVYDVYLQRWMQEKVAN